MYEIVNKRELTNNIFLMDIEAPRVAKSAKPGQFIIVRNNEKGERIPLTIADYDKERGTVSIVFQTVGKGTKELASYEIGEEVADFVGPLGQPSEFIHENLEELKKKKIIFIAGGVVKFACVDGPEFDGHLVNYDESMRRQTMYKTEEGKAQLKAEEGNTHSNGGCGCRGNK